MVLKLEDVMLQGVCFWTWKMLGLGGSQSLDKFLFLTSPEQRMTQSQPTQSDSLHLGLTFVRLNSFLYQTAHLPPKSSNQTQLYILSEFSMSLNCPNFGTSVVQERTYLISTVSSALLHQHF